MTQKNLHYEAAFEDYLRSSRIAYIPVDETKKTLFGRMSLKSFDFMVFPDQGKSLIIDVKGRKFPELKPGKTTGSGAWENWVTEDDISGLKTWQHIMGSDSESIFVFAYWVQGAAHNAPFDNLHMFRGKNYAFSAVKIDDYTKHSRTRSQKWRTVSVPVAKFIPLVTDLDELVNK